MRCENTCRPCLAAPGRGQGPTGSHCAPPRGASRARCRPHAPPAPRAAKVAPLKSSNCQPPPHFCTQYVISSPSEAVTEINPMAVDDLWSVAQRPPLAPLSLGSAVRSALAHTHARTHARTHTHSSPPLISAPVPLCRLEVACAWPAGMWRRSTCGAARPWRPATTRRRLRSACSAWAQVPAALHVACAAAGAPRRPPARR